MKNTDVIIIGAGAAGLIAARQISRSGKKVIVLEGRERIGGRIFTYRDKHFPEPVELGAEFIHGKQEITLNLLKENDIDYFPVSGQIWHYRKGKLEQDRDFVKQNHNKLAKELKSQKKDITVKKFLDEHFPGKENNTLRRSVEQFVSGYSTADVKKASTFAFREEWQGAEDWEQSRIQGGYGKLIDALAGQCYKNGVEIHKGSIVKKIIRDGNTVDIICENENSFRSRFLLVTVPIGVLISGKILFEPTIVDKINAAKKLGFGNVTKTLLLFKEKFWDKISVDVNSKAVLNKLFFLFSDEKVPTWWTQHPSAFPLLTGWSPGKAGENIFEKSISSLSSIFSIKEHELKNMLSAKKIHDWNLDPFSMGSYSYTTVNAGKYIELLGEPIEDCIYFAGEALAPDYGSGLVESALASGMRAAEKIILKN